MLKILIIIFESSFGVSTLYVSNNYALYSTSIGNHTDETLHDLHAKKRYIKVNGEFIEFVSDSLVSDLFKVNMTEDNSQNTEFMGYESFEINGTVSKNNYTGITKDIYSIIPILDDFVYNESEKLFLPLVKVINSKIYIRTYLAESHNGSFDENSIILEKLKSVGTIEVELDFFSKLLINE